MTHIVKCISFWVLLVFSLKLIITLFFNLLFPMYVSLYWSSSLWQKHTSFLTVSPMRKSVKFIFLLADISPAFLISSFNQTICSLRLSDLWSPGLPFAIFLWIVFASFLYPVLHAFQFLILFLGFVGACVLSCFSGVRLLATLWL